jgi:7-cyano-7-deazaguanine synthase in queuosine biosynthesis
MSRESLIAPQIAVDFYRLAATAFSADLRVSRAAGFNGWQRDFTLHVPVQDPTLWDSVAPSLKQLLGFLSGDTWNFAFRQRAIPGPIRNTRSKSEHRDAAKVCLLSGGLDSFAGAVKELTEGQEMICVSHNAAGSSAFSSPAQDRAMAHLRKITRPEAVSHVKVSVSPPTNISGESEPTQRSRSIMFVGIGVLVAAAAAARAQRPVPLVVPENGFISLNVPLTSGRLGSLSTRTTHPYFIECLQLLLDSLRIGVQIETPYRYLTKGQMLLQSPNHTAIISGARDTVSCAHPSVRRFNVSRSNHCGYCVPCIIRRAAMHAAGLDAAADYTFDVVAAPEALSHGQARDLRAFQMALVGRGRQSSRAVVLAVAPIPGGPSAVTKSIAVYEAGLDEVQHLF